MGGDRRGRVGGEGGVEGELEQTPPPSADATPCTPPGSPTQTSSQCSQYKTPAGSPPHTPDPTERGSGGPAADPCGDVRLQPSPGLAAHRTSAEPHTDPTYQVVAATSKVIVADTDTAQHRAGHRRGAAGSAVAEAPATRAVAPAIDKPPSREHRSGVVSKLSPSTPATASGRLPLSPAAHPTGLGTPSHDGAAAAESMPSSEAGRAGIPAGCTSRGKHNADSRSSAAVSGVNGEGPRAREGGRVGEGGSDPPSDPDPDLDPAVNAFGDARDGAIDSNLDANTPARAPDFFAEAFGAPRDGGGEGQGFTTSETDDGSDAVPSRLRRRIRSDEFFDATEGGDGETRGEGPRASSASSTGVGTWMKGAAAHAEAAMAARSGSQSCSSTSPSRAQSWSRGPPPPPGGFTTPRRTSRRFGSEGNHHAPRSAFRPPHSTSRRTPYTPGRRRKIKTCVDICRKGEHSKVNAIEVIEDKKVSNLGGTV